MLTIVTTQHINRDRFWSLTPSQPLPGELTSLYLTCCLHFLHRATHGDFTTLHATTTFSYQIKTPNSLLKGTTKTKHSMSHGLDRRTDTPHRSTLHLLPHPPLASLSPTPTNLYDQTIFQKTPLARTHTWLEHFYTLACSVELLQKQTTYVHPYAPTEASNYSATS